MSDEQELKPDLHHVDDYDPPIHVPDYVYDEIGPSFTPALILRKENQELFRKR